MAIVIADAELAHSIIKSVRSIDHFDAILDL
jgi:hypothetical protein